MALKLHLTHATRFGTNPGSRFCANFTIAPTRRVVVIAIRLMILTAFASGFSAAAIILRDGDLAVNGVTAS